MSLINLLITLVIYGLIFAIIWWAIAQIPMPSPFNWVARAIFALIVVLVLLSMLGGIGPVTLPDIRVGR